MQPRDHSFAQPCTIYCNIFSNLVSAHRVTFLRSSSGPMRSGGGPMPPPPPPGPPGLGPHPSGNMTIRRPIQTTFKLPTVHWTSMKPNDTKDTVWYLMDDSKVRKDLDLASFEETFKLAHQVGVHDEMSQDDLVWNRTWLALLKMSA